MIRSHINDCSDVWLVGFPAQILGPSAVASAWRKANRPPAETQRTPIGRAGEVCPVRALAAHNADNPAGGSPVMVNDDSPSSHNRRG